jgi:hypothetical protein
LGLNDPLLPLSSLLYFPIFDFPLPNYLLYRHSKPPRLDSHDEFWRVEDAMTKILGLKPKYFRPPYGKYNDQVLQVAAQRGYTKMILWSDDTQDASGECEFGFTCDPGLPGCRRECFEGMTLMTGLGGWL